MRSDPGGARAQPPELLRDRRPPRRPGGVRPDRRTPPRHPPARGLGRRRPGGRTTARGRADEGHGPGGGPARRDAGERLHGLGGLAHALLVPTERLRRGRARLRGLRASAGARSSTCSTPRACASGSRCTRPRSRTTSSRRGRRSMRSAAARASGSTSTRATSRHQHLDSAAFVLEFADRIYHVHVKDSKKTLDGRRSILGGHLNFGELERGWDFVSPGHGDVDFEALDPRPEQDRLRGAALDRVGGLRDGPRVGRAGRAGVRAADGLHAVRPWRSTRRCSGADVATSATPPRRSAPATIPEIGVGMLGYAFMGKAHSNAFKKIAYMTWPPPLVPRLVSIAGRNEEARAERGRALRVRALDDRLARPRRRSRRSACSTTAVRTRCTRSRRSPPPRRASTCSARSRSAAPPTRATRSGGASPRPESSTCARSTTASSRRAGSRASMIEAGELGEIRHFRGRYLQDWGDDPKPRHLALPRRTRRARARSATSARTSSTSPVRSSASSRRCRRS